MRLFEEMGKKPPALMLLEEVFNTPLQEAEAPSQYMSPSSLNCDLGCRFKLEGTPVTIRKESFSDQQIPQSGEDCHRRIQTFLSQTPYWVDIQQYVKARGLPLTVEESEDSLESTITDETRKLRFRCDGLLFIYKHFILEIKTEIERKWCARTEPDPRHQSQGIAYSMELKVPNILWCYVNRNTLQRKLYMQSILPSDWASLDRRLEHIRTAPISELNANKSACTYCDYTQACKAELKRRKEQ